MPEPPCVALQQLFARPLAAAESFLVLVLVLVGVGVGAAAGVVAEVVSGVAACGLKEYILTLEMKDTPTLQQRQLSPGQLFLVLVAPEE